MGKKDLFWFPGYTRSDDGHRNSGQIRQILYIFLKHTNEAQMYQDLYKITWHGCHE